MSFSYLWPSNLAFVDETTFFWTPMVNDNSRLIDRVMSPAVALFKTAQTIRPRRVVSLHSSDGISHQVLVGANGPLLGVSAGHTDEAGHILVKMYGLAVVEPDAPVTNADIGKAAIVLADGRVEVTSSVSKHDDCLGMIIKVIGERPVVAMRTAASLDNAGNRVAYLSNASRPVAPIAAHGVMPARLPDVHGFVQVHASCVVDRTAGTVTLSEPNGSVGCGAQVGFSMEDATTMTSSFSGSTVTLTLTRSFEVAHGSAHVLAMSSGASGGNIPINALSCAVSGSSVHLRSPDGAWPLGGSAHIQIAIIGVLTGA